MLFQNPTPEISKLEADLCYAFVEPIRILILYALHEKPHNVTELTHRFEAAQPTISRHLKILRDLGIVTTKRQGTTITYELADHRFIEALDILRSVLRDSITIKSDLINKIM